MRWDEALADQETQKDSAVGWSEDAKRRAWNAAMFEDLGFQSEIAHLLAAEKVDWHQAKRLTDKGCSLNLVLRILL